MPDLCVPSEYENCLQALRHVDVVSPNHGELGGFFGKDTNGKDGFVNWSLIESLADHWLNSGIGSASSGGVVVRSGKDGCYIKVSTKSGRWIPAFHQSADHVVDPTGGGNGFLGGLAVGLVRCGERPSAENLEEAAIWGSVAASFAIEQVGMPVLRTEEGDGKETWNGVIVGDRVAELKQRLKSYVHP